MSYPIQPEEVIRLSPAEVSSNYSRVRFAEGLILQLPADHDGRNSWLLNYGTSQEAVNLRHKRNLVRQSQERPILYWDKQYDCLQNVGGK